MGILIDTATGNETQTQTVEIVIRLEIREDVDYTDVINEMDYDFRHKDIIDMEIVDIITEN